MKKGLKIGIGVTTLVGVTTAIAVPSVLATKKKTDVLNEQNLKGIAVKGRGNVPEYNTDNFINLVKDENNASPTDLITEAQKLTAKFEYSEEQKGSIELQKMSFKYDIYKLDKENDELIEESGKWTTESDKTAHENRIKEISDRQDAIKNSKKIITDKIDAINNISFDEESVTFNIDYPIILNTEVFLNKKQTKILADERNGQVGQFPTRAEGEKNWIDIRANGYGGSTTDQEAINFLVYNEMKGKYNLKNARSIKSNYTVEEALAKDADDNFIYPFLNDFFKTQVTLDANTTFNEGETTDLKYLTGDKSGEKVKYSDKVFYFGSNSNVPSKIIVNPEVDEASIIDASKTNNLIKLQHYLIGAVQDEKGYTLPWTISKDSIKKLFLFYGPGSEYETGGTRWIGEKFSSGTTRADNGINNLFGSSDEDITFTKEFIKTVSDNGGTKNNSGDLGTKGELDTISSMVPGFGIGLLEALEDMNPHDDPDKGTSGKITKNINPDGQDIIDGIQEIVTNTINPATKKPFINNDEFSQYINSRTDAEVKYEFGTKFRNIFSNGNEFKLEYAYKVGAEAANEGKYILISKNGIHLIKVTKIGDATKLADKITKDIEKGFNDQSTSKITNDYSKIFSKYNDVNKIMKTLLDNSDTRYIDYIYKNIDDKFKKDSKDDPIEQIELITMLSEIIDANLAQGTTSKIKEVFNDSLTAYYTKSFDNKLRSQDITLSLEDIYKAIRAIAEDEGTVV